MMGRKRKLLSAIGRDPRKDFPDFGALLTALETPRVRTVRYPGPPARTVVYAKREYMWDVYLAWREGGL